MLAEETKQSVFNTIGSFEFWRNFFVEKCAKAIAGLLIKNFHSTLISAYINFTATVLTLMQYKKEVTAIRSDPLA
jgi:hypothetical protein